MKILKKIIVILIALFVLLWIVSLFLNKHWHVEHSMVMSAPAENIFIQINTLKNWEKWSPWSKMDTAMQITYEGPESGVGASYSWKGTTKGTKAGKLTISESKPNELVITDLDFGEDGTGKGGFIIEPAEGGNKVTWYMDSEMDGMFQKYKGLMMTGMMEKIFDQGLNDIKNLAENMPPPSIAPEMSIEETTVAAQDYLAVRDTISIATIGMKLGQYYGMIQGVMKKQGLNMTGMPFAIYYTNSPDSWEMEAAIGTDKPGKPDGKVKPGKLNAGNAVVAHYFGDYHGLGAAHEAIDKYVAEKGKKVIGAPWEVYVTDPMMEKDTAKWQTDVFYPVE